MIKTNAITKFLWKTMVIIVISDKGQQFNYATIVTGAQSWE